MRSKTVKNILDRTSKSTHIFVRKYADITLRVNELIDQKKHFLDFKEGSEIKKWVDGEHTFSLEDIAKLEHELNATILEVTKCREIPKVETRIESRRKHSKES